MERPAQDEERVRRATDIGRAPTDPASRKTIILHPPPHDENFPDKGIVKVISHNCMDGWPTAVVTWAEAPQEYKTRAWEDFKARFTWDASIDAKVKELYAKKCAERTKGMFNTARTTAVRDAEKLHPGHGQEHMEDFPPWWYTHEIWAQMCQTWRGERWAKKSQVASVNRASSTADGRRAMGTYRGGTKSQLQYMKEKEAQHQAEGGTQTNWKDLYVSLRTNLPGTEDVSEQYDHLMAEKYPDASSRPSFDQDLWVTASGGAKKGYVKGLGFKRSRASDFTTCTSRSSSVGGSTATSAAPTSQQSAEEMVRAICTDQNLMGMLREALLSSMSTDQIGRHLAERAQSQGSANSQEHGNDYRKEGGMCKLINWMKPGEVVAEGRWMTSDPTTMVHCLPLGNNASKVFVVNATIPAALLWRLPDSEIDTIGKAVGVPIAWPTDYIIMEGEH